MLGTNIDFPLVESPKVAEKKRVSFSVCLKVSQSEIALL